MELKNFFNQKSGIASIVKVPFSKKIHGMTKCPPNLGHFPYYVRNIVNNNVDNEMEVV